MLDFLKRFLTANDLTIYPEYEHALEDLATYFGVTTDELTLTNGTDEAIQLVVNTFVDRGQQVLILQPSYAMYKFYSEACRSGNPLYRLPGEHARFSARRTTGANNSRNPGRLHQQSEQPDRHRYNRGVY